MTFLPGLTPDNIARALVLAARRRGFDPQRVFVPKARGAAQVRALAAHALARAAGAAFGWKSALAPVFQLHLAELSRSVDPDDVAAIAAELDLPRPLMAAAAAPCKPKKRAPIPAARTPAAAISPAPAAPLVRAEMVNGGGRTHDPIPARVARWARQFVDAGWSPREVAHLFDVHPAALKAAIGWERR